MKKTLTVSGRPKGVIQLPASKSLAHRSLICAALASGESLIKGLNLPGWDIAATLACLKSLGIDWQWEGDSLRIQGGSLSPEENAVLDVGESGSTLRFMLPLALISGKRIAFKGEGRIWERPLTEYLEALTARGAEIDFQPQAGHLVVQGGLKPGEYRLPGHISSQFVSGLLMVLPLLPGESRILLTSPLESRPYVDLTLQVMAAFGVEIEHDDYAVFRIPGGQSYQARVYEVEGDFSAASFFLAAAALGCDVRCAGLNPASKQGDREILTVIERAGGRIIQNPDGTLGAEGGNLQGIRVDCRDIPDLVPPMAVLLSFAQGESRLEQAARLRMKESDRLEAVADLLQALGGKVVQEEDALIITGAESLAGGLVDSKNDHRIAMAAALASLGCRGPVEIINPECVDKSYPGFWQHFGQAEEE